MPTGESWPTWFLTPSYEHENSDDYGGVRQGRITCHKFQHQTDPPEIEALYTPRGFLNAMPVVLSTWGRTRKS